MEVNVKRAGVIDFSEIAVEDVFYCNGTYMKIREFTNCYGKTYNAIDLTHGEFEYFASNNSVNRVRGSLNIEII